MVNNNRPKKEELKDTTRTFRLLYKMNLMRDYQKHGNITFWKLLWFIPKTLVKRALFSYSVMNYFFEPLNKKFIRPWIWKKLGCHLGKNVHIGHFVVPDFGNAERIHLGSNVVISNGVNILCHKRDISCYQNGDMATKLPFKYEDVIIEDNVQIGLNCTILPGVTIGEGAIIGSCSLITKSIPAWCIAVGSPAKVVRTLSTDNQVVNNCMGGGNRIVAISPCLIGNVA